MRSSAEILNATGSAEQLANPIRNGNQHHFHIACMSDVQRWLTEEHVVKCSNVDAQRIRQAMAVLSQQRVKQQDMRPLLHEWQVRQKRDKKDRQLSEMIQECQSKVVNSFNPKTI